MDDRAPAKKRLQSADDSEENASEFGEFEKAVLRVQGVAGARVVDDAKGRISEIHVLADANRSAKQIVRDIQSVALAGFGVELDYRKVSIVQLENGARPEVHEDSTADAVHDDPPRRASLERLTSSMEGPSTTIAVEIKLEDRHLEGTASGPASSSLRSAALATIQAVQPLVERATVQLDFVDVMSAGSHPVVVVVLSLSSSRGAHFTSGSALVRTDRHDAAARACLAALNRVSVYR